jgi:hypothetical protein
MEPPETCRCCRRVPDAARLEYRRGDRVVRNGALLQCDVCERLACADCLGVYDILSGYDFLCHDCARQIEPTRLQTALAQNQPDRPRGTKEVAVSPHPPRARPASTRSS